MNAKKRFSCRPRSVDADKVWKPRVFERAQYGLQTFDPLGMTRGHEMLEAGSVSNQAGGHYAIDRLSGLGQFTFARLKVLYLCPNVGRSRM
jgi:hypothetical protein